MLSRRICPELEGSCDCGAGAIGCKSISPPAAGGKILLPSPFVWLSPEGSQVLVKTVCPSEWRLQVAFTVALARVVSRAEAGL